MLTLEIMEKGKNYKSLKTNLPPFFWLKVKNIIRQNKKSALLEFLFGSQNQILEEKIKNLQNQVNYLQQELIELKQNQTIEIKNTRMELLNQSEAVQTDDDDTRTNIGYYFQEDATNINSNLQQIKSEIVETDVETKIQPLKTLSRGQQYDNSDNPEKGLYRQNFITLGKILKKDLIEIIKIGFQQQSNGKISLKKYYESTDQYSLFKLRGYSIKYEAVRKNKLYKQLKP